LPCGMVSCTSSGTAAPTRHRRGSSEPTGRRRSGSALRSGCRALGRKPIANICRVPRAGLTTRGS
jgi:hypothetical protein